MKLDDLAAREPQHVMVFGDSKSGKSTLVSELAEAGFNLIWLSLDNGHRVLYKLSPEARKRIEIIVFPDTRDFPVAADVCSKLLKGDKVLLCHMHGLNNCSVCKRNELPSTEYCFKDLPLDTIVVLDHATQLTDSCIANITKGKPVDYKLQIDDWGSLRFNMLSMMGHVQHAPFNIICLAQAMESEMEDGKHKIVPYVGSREFGKSVGSYFDHIVYTEVVNRKHKAGSSTSYSASILTGSRSDVVIEKSEKVSLLPIFDGSLEKAKVAADLAESKRVLANSAPVVTASTVQHPLVLPGATKEVKGPEAIVVGTTEILPPQKVEAAKPVTVAATSQSPSNRAQELLAGLRNKSNGSTGTKQ